MLQSTYGLASMFAPSSAILLIGLSYLGITYKEWMKYIWKFVLAMFIVILVLMVIIC
jgi:C4-dicarboxylate anaerobic carrier.